MTSVVIGVGNAFRRDDGLGLVVAERLAGQPHDGFDVVALDGEPSRVVDAWTGTALAVVIDALRSPEPPGTILRYEAGLDPVPAERVVSSSHTMGPGEAYELGVALDRLPARLVIYGVVGEEFTEGQGLSPAVVEAVDGVVDAVIDELARHDPVG